MASFTLEEKVALIHAYDKNGEKGVFEIISFSASN